MTDRKQENKIVSQDTLSGVLCFALVAVTFLLTSSGYLSWLYHLLMLVPAQTADLLSMGAGYLLQAVGLLLAAVLMRRLPVLFHKALLGTICSAFLICLVPSVLSRQPVSVVLFGLLMNLCCGLLASFYLLSLCKVTGYGKRSVLFSGGYALSALLSWLFSLVGNGRLFRSGSALLLCLLLALATFLLQTAFDRTADNSKEAAVARGSFAPLKTTASDASPLSRRLLLLVGSTVFLMCTVKNMGFSFPSSDLGSGINLELSRLLYAAGLIIAGLVGERNRRWGAVSTLAALITPFLMLTLIGQEVPHMILWCLDYLLFGFFSVWRAVVFCDLAVQTDRPWLSGAGLMLGRSGDAAGTLLCRLLGAHTTVLILSAAALFVVTLILFLQVYQALYLPTAVKEKSDRERFEQFAVRHDLSSREREVLQQLVFGSTNAEIAQKLFVSESTVKFHVHNLLQKTGCRSRLELRRAVSNFRD